MLLTANKNVIVEMLHLSALYSVIIWDITIVHSVLKLTSQ